jgi:Na+(H+)/acetate symporter ActP
MGLTSEQIVDLAHEMARHAERIARRMHEGVSAQDIERLQHWRDVIAQQVTPQCVAVQELDAVIDAAPKVADLQDTERVAVSTLRIALILAAAAGALLEVGRKFYFEELLGE